MVFPWAFSFLILVFLGLHEMKRGQFKIKRFLDVGTDNPICSRLFGLCRIVDSTCLENDDKDIIRHAVLEVIANLVKAERIAKKLSSSIQNVVTKLNERGVSTQNKGATVHIPDTEGLDYIREYLKYLKKALQVVVPVFNVFLETTFNGPHFHKIRGDLIKKYGDSFPLAILVKRCQNDWIKKILELRNEDEHPKQLHLYLDFDISWNEKNQDWEIYLPVFYEGTDIFSFLFKTIGEVLVFSEESIVLVCREHLPEMADVYEIPKEKRNRENDVRFTIGLEAGFKIPKF